MYLTYHAELRHLLHLKAALEATTLVVEAGPHLWLFDIPSLHTRVGKGCLLAIAALALPLSVLLLLRTLLTSFLLNKGLPDEHTASNLRRASGQETFEDAADACGRDHSAPTAPSA